MTYSYEIEFENEETRLEQEERDAFALFDGTADDSYEQSNDDEGAEYLENDNKTELNPQSAVKKDITENEAGVTHVPAQNPLPVMSQVMAATHQSLNMLLEAEINILYGNNYPSEHTKLILAANRAYDGVNKDELETLVDKVYAQPIIPDSAYDHDLATYCIPLCKEKVCLTKPDAKWFWWNGQVWESDNANLELESCIQKLILNVPNFILDAKEKKTAQKIVRSSSTVGRVLQSMRRVIKPVTSSVFDANPNILNCENGIIELSSEPKFRPATPVDYVTRKAKVHYRAGAQCPKFRRYLTEVMMGDEDNMRLIQGMMGYMLLGGENRERLMFWLLGGGRNGKSTLIRVLMTLMGTYATSILLSTLMTGQKSGPRDDLMSLVTSRLLTVNEFDEKDNLEARTAKSLTGNDFMKARFLYGNFTDILIGGLPIVTTNSMPMISDDNSEALWDRFRIIPFRRRFQKQEINAGLYHELVEELPGILNFALEGLVNYLRDKETLVMETPAMIEAKNQYRVRSNPISSFISMHYQVVDPRIGKTMAKDILEDYTKWAMQNTISVPISFQKLKVAMHALGIPENATGGRFYACLRKQPEQLVNEIYDEIDDNGGDELSDI